MTVDSLIELGNDRPVLYKGMRVIFRNLSMDFKPWTGRRQPWKASIELPHGRTRRVFPSMLEPLSGDAA